MVRVSGFLSRVRNGANGHEWTDDGPQNGPQFLNEFWGSLSMLVHLLHPLDMPGFGKIDSTYLQAET